MFSGSLIELHAETPVYPEGSEHQEVGVSLLKAVVGERTVVDVHSSGLVELQGMRVKSGGIEVTSGGVQVGQRRERF